MVTKSFVLLFSQTDLDHVRMHDAMRDAELVLIPAFTARSVNYG